MAQPLKAFAGKPDKADKAHQDGMVRGEKEPHRLYSDLHSDTTVHVTSYLRNKLSIINTFK